MLPTPRKPIERPGGRVPCSHARTADRGRAGPFDQAAGAAARDRDPHISGRLRGRPAVQAEHGHRQPASAHRGQSGQSKAGGCPRSLRCGTGVAAEALHRARPSGAAGDKARGPFRRGGTLGATPVGRGLDGGLGRRLWRRAVACDSRDRSAGGGAEAIGPSDARRAGPISHQLDPTGRNLRTASQHRSGSVACRADEPEGHGQRHVSADPAVHLRPQTHDAR